MLRPTLLIIIITIGLIAQGCSLLFDSNRKHRDVKTLNKDIFIHTVNFPGETLELVGRWYTGGTMQQARIRKSNPGLTHGLLPLGVRIEIPREIMSTDKLLPVEYVKKNSQVSSSPFILNTPLENPGSEELPEVAAPIEPVKTLRDLRATPTAEQYLQQENSAEPQTIIIPSQIVDELKELGSEQSGTEELVTDPPAQPTIFAEPRRAVPIPVATPNATMSAGRRRLLEQLKKD